MIEALIFDYGGVVSEGGRDLEPASRLAKNLGISKEIGLSLIKDQWIDFAKGLKSEDDFWRATEGSVGHNIPFNAKNIWNTYDSGMKPIEEVLQFIEALKLSGYVIGLLSNVIPPTARSIRLNGGYDIFDFTVLSCEVGLLKPDAAIYDLSLKNVSKLDPKSVLFLDDKPTNLAPAESLGMKTILVQNPAQMIQDAESLLKLRWTH